MTNKTKTNWTYLFSQANTTPAFGTQGVDVWLLTPTPRNSYRTEGSFDRVILNGQMTSLFLNSSHLKSAS